MPLKTSKLFCVLLLLFGKKLWHFMHNRYYDNNFWFFLTIHSLPLLILTFFRQSFNELKIGSPGSRQQVAPHPLESLGSSLLISDPRPLPRISLPGISLFKMALPHGSTGGSTGAAPVVSTAPGRQDAQHGMVTSILGQVGSVIVLHEALTDEQCKAINAVGKSDTKPLPLINGAHTHYVQVLPVNFGNKIWASMPPHLPSS